MKRIITYSLRGEQNQSDEYYRTVARFSQAWLEDARRTLGATVKDFQGYREASGLSVRSFEECAFELLVLGVLLKEHGAQAVRLPAWPRAVLTGLISLQARHPRLEKGIKALRGAAVMASCLLFSPKIGPARPGAEAAKGDCTVPQLIAWLRAIDYGGQAERLDQWQSYLATLEPGKASGITGQCLAAAGAFASQSETLLGPYTQNVGNFIAGGARSHRWAYDRYFVSRTPLEYHLGMLGTEILNHAYRENFMKTGRKVVILPPCMRAQPEETCRSLDTPLGKRCRYCTPGCAIAAATRLGEQRGFEVYQMPDELRKFRSPSSPGTNTFGVVGVSCVLTNWPGGWDLEKEGIPGQGLPLDFVGCSYHWDKKGIPTEINLGKLSGLIHEFTE